MFLCKLNRLNLGLSQRAVVRLSKGTLTQAVISGVEVGRTNPTQAEREAFARIVGCAPDRLLVHVTEPGDGAEARDARRG